MCVCKPWRDVVGSEESLWERHCHIEFGLRTTTSSFQPAPSSSAAGSLLLAAVSNCNLSFAATSKEEEAKLCGGHEAEPFLLESVPTGSGGANFFMGDAASAGGGRCRGLLRSLEVSAQGGAPREERSDGIGRVPARPYYMCAMMGKEGPCMPKRGSVCVEER